MQIYKVLDKGSFTVGVSTYKNKELFDKVYKDYRISHFTFFVT